MMKTIKNDIIQMHAAGDFIYQMSNFLEMTNWIKRDLKESIWKGLSPFT